MRQAALASVLSKKLKDQELRVYEGFSLQSPKTKFASEMFKKALGIGARAKRFDMLIVREPENAGLVRAVRNLVKAKVLSANSLNVEDLLNYKYVLFEEKALEAMGKPVTGKSVN